MTRRARKRDFRRGSISDFFNKIEAKRAFRVVAWNQLLRTLLAHICAPTWSREILSDSWPTTVANEVLQRSTQTNFSDPSYGDSSRPTHGQLSKVHSVQRRAMANRAEVFAGASRRNGGCLEGGLWRLAAHESEENASGECVTGSQCVDSVGRSSGDAKPSARAGKHRSLTATGHQHPL